MTRGLLLGLLLLASPASADPAAWKVDPARSKIEFSGTGPNGAFTGKFGKWTADIRFAAAELPASRAAVSIQLDSVSTSDAMGTAALKEQDWFDVARFPQATFKTSTIRSLGANRYEAAGTLSLHGVSIPITLPFTLDISGASATMKGAVSVDRTSLGLGKAYGADMISKLIKVDITLIATR